MDKVHSVKRSRCSGEACIELENPQRQRWRGRRRATWKRTAEAEMKEVEER